MCLCGKEMDEHTLGQGQSLIKPQPTQFPPLSPPRLDELRTKQCPSSRKLSCLENPPSSLQRWKVSLNPSTFESQTELYKPGKSGGRSTKHVPASRGMVVLSRLVAIASLSQPPKVKLISFFFVYDSPFFGYRCLCYFCKNEHLGQI